MQYSIQICYEPIGVKISNHYFFCKYISSFSVFYKIFLCRLHFIWFIHISFLNFILFLTQYTFPIHTFIFVYLLLHMSNIHLSRCQSRDCSEIDARFRQLGVLIKHWARVSVKMLMMMMMMMLLMMMLFLLLLLIFYYIIIFLASRH